MISLTVRYYCESVETLLWLPESPYVYLKRINLFLNKSSNFNRLETNTESNKKNNKRKREALELYPFQHEVDYLRFMTIIKYFYLEENLC